MHHQHLPDAFTFISMLVQFLVPACYMVVVALWTPSRNPSHLRPSALSPRHRPSASSPSFFTQSIIDILELLTLNPNIDKKTSWYCSWWCSWPSPRSALPLAAAPQSFELRVNGPATRAMAEALVRRMAKVHKSTVSPQILMNSIRLWWLDVLTDDSLRRSTASQHTGASHYKLTAILQRLAAP